MRALYLLVILIVALFSSCEKGEPVGKSRGINQKIIEKRNTEKAYDYNRTVEQSSSSFLSTLMTVLHNVGKYLGSTFGIILIVAVLVFVVLYFIKSQRTGFNKGDPFIRKSKKLEEEEIEDLDKMPLAKLENKIAFALKNLDYRTAIRYSFMALLLSLNDKKAIQYHLEKTNIEYQREIKKEIKPDFRKLCFIYDCVWYGSYKSTSHTWSQFLNLKTQLLKHE